LPGGGCSSPADVTTISRHTPSQPPPRSERTTVGALSCHVPQNRAPRGAEQSVSRQSECALPDEITCYFRFAPEPRGGSSSGEAWSESLDLTRHSRVSKATLENSSHPTRGEEVNQSDFRRLNSARFTNPHQKAGSQQPCCNPQQETQTPFVRPTSPPLPSLTSFGASLSAPASTRNCTTGRWP
jgi:hypothetical protein